MSIRPAAAATDTRGAIDEQITALASLRVRPILWVAALSLLAVGPGTLGYSRCVFAAEAIVASLFLWSLVRHERRPSPLERLAALWFVSELFSTAWGYVTGWGTHSPYPFDLYAGGWYGPLRILGDTAAALMGCLAAAWPRPRSGNAANDASAAETISAMPVLITAAVVALLCGMEEARNLAYGTDDPRIQATFTNPNLLGSFLCLTLPLAAGVAAAGEGLRRSARLASGLLALALIFAVLLTQSRGAILGCAVGGLYLAAALWARRGADTKEIARRGRRALVVSLGSALAICAVAMALFPHLLHESRSASDAQRRAAWTAAVIVIRSQPLLGIGVDGYPAAISALHLKEANPETPDGLPLIPSVHLHAHDLLLQSWVERGLPGLLLAACLVFMVLRRAGSLVTHPQGRSSGTVAIAATACLIAALAQNVADYTLWYAPVDILMWYLLGLIFPPE